MFYTGKLQWATVIGLVTIA